MSLSPLEAAKHVGLTKQSIIKAIKNGRLSANKSNNGEWRIEPVELFRVWPPVTQYPATLPLDTTVEVSTITPPNYTPENGDMVAVLKTQIEDLREDRDHWRNMAERLSLTDQREPESAPQKQGFWSRVFGS